MRVTLKIWLSFLGFFMLPASAEEAVSPFRVTTYEGEGADLSFVYVHGVYHGGWSFDRLHPLLRSRAVNQYVVDLRGHYGAHRVQADDDIGYADYFEDLIDALDEIPGEKLLIGHSLGGLLSMSALSREDVTGAVLLATPLPEVIRAKRWGLLFRYPLKSMKMIFGRDAASFYHNKAWAKRYFFSESTPSFIFERAFKNIALQNEPFKLFDDINSLRIDVKNVNKPVMVVAGGEDPTVDVRAANLLANQFQIDPEIIAGAGHDLMLEPQYAEQIAGLIKLWLTKQGL